MFNDADIEDFELRSQANSMNHATKKHGICFHGHTKGFSEIKCLLCGKIFASEAEWMSEMNDLKMEWC